MKLSIKILIIGITFILLGVVFVYGSNVITNVDKKISPSSSIKQSNALIILNFSDKLSMQQSRDYIENLGGKIRHIYPPYVFIGYIPREISQNIIGQKNIVNIYYTEIDSSILQKYGKSAVYAANAWNKNFMGIGLKDEPVPEPGPILNDALIPPDYEQARGSMKIHHSPPGPTETSQFMIRDVSVAIIFLESNGSIDIETENWTSTEENNVISEIQAGLDWWVNKEPDADITFTYGHTNYSVPTSYEPINRPLSNQSLWINDAMNYLGYTNGTYFSKVRTYDNSIRNLDGTDWGFTIFIVDSSNDTDGKFTDDKFAYAYFNGPFTVMTYGNNGYGIGWMEAVIAHETGHIFGAADQYNGSWTCDEDSDCNTTFGYLKVENQNCVRTACTLNESSIMRGGIAPYTNNDIDPYAKGQLGWRDNDTDNILDAMDSNYNPDDDTDGDGIVDYWDDCPTITGPPDNDGCPYNRFYIKNNSGDSVAWLGSEGNIVLKGNCSISGACTPPSDSFIFKDSSNNVVSYLDSYGNLCIETGDCSDQSASCNPINDAYIVKNETGSIVSYIDITGDLCLTGVLIEYGTP